MTDTATPASRNPQVATPETSMKAVGYARCLPADHPEALLDIMLPRQQPGATDLLIAVHAVAVNPVDTKIRRTVAPAEGEHQVLGWDAAGIVLAVGAAVTRFRPGDRVWYAGAVQRPGSNSECQLVDERIAGHMPASLSFAEAAAMPLTTVTAWELLFERLQVARTRQHAQAGRSGQSLLVIGAGGGVGSMLIQLARQLTDLTVIATASRPETAQWVRDLGAHEVIDHRLPLSGELARIDHPQVSHVASLTATHQHFAEIVACLAPQGRLALIDDPEPLDIRLLKRKSLSLHWEFMFTRSLFGTDDMAVQHDILEEVAGLVDAGVLRTTLAAHFGLINAANLRRAHALLESGQARGKIVLEGF